jgi:nucleotide-binding universal stress UspA family protein
MVFSSITVETLIRKALIAIDGSQPSHQAMRYALDILPGDVEIFIISVKPEGAKEDLDKSYDSYYENVLKNAETEIKKKRPDLQVKTLLLEGLPAEEICFQANSKNVDIIIMGSRGVGGVKGWILGSVSRNVVNSCTKPVLIVK